MMAIIFFGMSAALVSGWFGRRPLAIARRRNKIQVDHLAGGDVDAPLGEVAQPEFRPLQIGERRQRPLHRQFGFADVLRIAR